jgi:hypothetical protein
MTSDQRLQSILDLASARLRNGPLDPNVEHDLGEIVRLATPEKWLPYPPGMQAESQRLHREYNALVAAQNAGAKNGPEVVRLTDECATKGIVLVPGGENL